MFENKKDKIIIHNLLPRKLQTTFWLCQTCLKTTTTMICKFFLATQCERIWQLTQAVVMMHRKQTKASMCAKSEANVTAASD